MTFRVPSHFREQKSRLFQEFFQVIIQYACMTWMFYSSSYNKNGKKKLARFSNYNWTEQTFAFIAVYNNMLFSCSIIQFFCKITAVNSIKFVFQIYAISPPPMNMANSCKSLLPVKYCVWRIIPGAMGTWLYAVYLFIFLLKQKRAKQGLKVKYINTKHLNLQYLYFIKTQISCYFSILYFFSILTTLLLILFYFERTFFCFLCQDTFVMSPWGKIVQYCTIYPKKVLKEHHLQN